ncbi:gastric inhibitory polypeptide receptor [Clarias gariepinus]|uniref:gastric inhibitory polypeptide receptor n=1 Tax=Clarias gariepinus TaxID=13013 RepID=UPI00234CA2C7|nr:gastric inhibitory polypeptide receptor [Clarias gariepinus]
MPGPHLGTLLVMKRSSAVLLLTLSVLYSVECKLGEPIQQMVQEWERYRKECISNISSEPIPSGLFCKRMFDHYACWTDGLPNTTVKVPCPWYLPWYNQVRSGFVLRECGPDGQWHTKNTSNTWRNNSQCEAHKGQEEQMWILACFRAMYTVGYYLSLASLTLALIILFQFRRLRCTRNYIHANLFASFILRAASILTRDILLHKLPLDAQYNYNSSTVLSDHISTNMTTDFNALTGCRIAQVVMQYCVGASYFWLLVEGLYLHNLLILFVFSENSYLCGYVILGWGTPLLYVVPWIILRQLRENHGCWEKNENMVHWWIIQTPTYLAIFANFYVFIRILRLLVSKLKANQMRQSDNKFRLAKSTLTLIPLLGIHKVVFTMMSEETNDSPIRNIWLFFELFFNSFQGLLVATLYCFVNKEVQSEIKKEWQCWKLGMSTLDEQPTTSSHVLQGASGPQEHETQPRCLSSNEESCLPMDPRSSFTHIPLHLRHPKAKKDKAYCYISVHKQMLNISDPSAPDHCEAEGGCSESYC